MTGSFCVKCSMIAPRIMGLSCGQSPPDFVTVMKSPPEHHADTPSISNSRCASGDFAADARVGKSATPSPRTAAPGKNFSVAGLGVDSVWMNMVSQNSGLPIEATTDIWQHWRPWAKSQANASIASSLKPRPARS